MHTKQGRIYTFAFQTSILTPLIDFKCSAQLNCESVPLFCFQCLHLKGEKLLHSQCYGSQSNPSITSCYENIKEVVACEIQHQNGEH